MISIIVPVYNTEKYLEKCVRSIMAQTENNIEILLVDDGSTDGSGKLCEVLAKEDARIRVFHKENGGSSSARNLGIVKARGEYLGFIDSDDYIEPDMYRVLYEALMRTGAGAAQIGRNEIDESGKLMPDICPPPGEETIVGAEEFFRELLMHRGDCSFCTKLIRRELILTDENEECFPLGVLNEDFHLLISRLPKIEKIVSLPGYYYHVFYRIGSNSRKDSPDKFSRVFSDNVDNADYALSLVRKYYPENEELQKIAFRFGIFQRLDYMLHIPIGQMEKNNEMYMKVVKHLRRNYLRILGNRYLTVKNKVYATLFAAAPRGVRKLHRKIMQARQ